MAEIELMANSAAARGGVRAPELNDYFALCIAFAASSLTVALNVEA
jgi:hypothetical protein